jgi:hypothetical protein
MAAGTGNGSGSGMIQLVVKAERKRAFEPNCHLTTAVVS